MRKKNLRLTRQNLRTPVLYISFQNKLKKQKISDTDEEKYNISQSTM